MLVGSQEGVHEASVPIRIDLALEGARDRSIPAAQQVAVCEEVVAVLADRAEEAHLQHAQCTVQ